VIDTISHNDNLNAGDTLTVVIIGTPGGVATFDVLGLSSSIPAPELSPGHYEGHLFVGNEVNWSRGSVLGHLVLNGVETTMQSNHGVTFTGLHRSAVSVHRVQTTYVTSVYPDRLRIYPTGSIYNGVYRWGYTSEDPFDPTYAYGYPFRNPFIGGVAYSYPTTPMFVHVLSPTSGSALNGDFTVRGVTLPYSTVTVQTTLRRLVTPNDVESHVWTFKGVADGAGNFAIPMAAFPPGSRLDMRVVAEDPAGNVSRAAAFDIATAP